MVLITTPSRRQRSKTASKTAGKAIFKQRLAKPNHMTKNREGRKNQDIRIPKATGPKLPAAAASRRKRK